MYVYGWRFARRRREIVSANHSMIFPRCTSIFRCATESLGVDEAAIRSAVHALAYTMVQAAKKRTMEQDFRANVTEELKLTPQHTDILTAVSLR